MWNACSARAEWCPTRLWTPSRPPSSVTVIPANAGIHFDVALDLLPGMAPRSRWIPAFAGMTTLLFEASFLVDDEAKESLCTEDAYPAFTFLQAHPEERSTWALPPSCQAASGNTRMTRLMASRSSTVSIPWSGMKSTTRWNLQSSREITQGMETCMEIGADRDGQS